MQVLAYLFIGIFCCVSMLLADTEIYRSVDDSGQVTFSDQPVADAEKLAVDPASNRYQYRVEKVYDGDTLILQNGERVRLLNINAPEISSRFRNGESGGEAARQWLETTIGEAPVYLRFDQEKRDDYDRLLAHVFLENEQHVNQMLVAKGLASLTVHPPNLLYVDSMHKAQQQAIAAGKGIWQNTAYPLRLAKAGLPAEQRRGWQRWLITPKAIDETPSEIRLLAGDNLSLRIKKAQLDLFPEIESYLHQTLEVHGWLSKRGEAYFISVRHPSAILR